MLSLTFSLGNLTVNVQTQQGRPFRGAAGRSLKALRHFRIRQFTDFVRYILGYNVRTMTPEPPKGKSKEEMLRDEVRFYADLMQKYMQWGLTVMVTLQTAIFFVRRDLVQTYVDAQILQKGQELPYYRYGVGTIFLCLTAFVLQKFTARIIVQYRFYKKQLVESAESGIKDNATTGVSSWGNYLFFAFPLYDLAVRIWVDFSVHLAIH